MVRVQKGGMPDKMVSKHIIEMRFRPDAGFLDKRGKVAESITASDAPLKRWNVSANRIDFASYNNQSIRAFFSYRNLGVVSTPPNDTEYFVKTAQAFVTEAWKHLPNREFSRMGILSRFLVETEDFEKARNAYRNRFLKLPDEDLEAFGGKLDDVGFSLNFVDRKKHFNITTGPMEKAQARNLLSDSELPFIRIFAESPLSDVGDVEAIALPDAGIYVEVDFFRKNFPQQMKATNVLELLGEGLRRSKELTTLISNWITEQD